MGCHFPVASHYTYVMSIYYTMRYDIGKCTTHTYVENPLQSDPHIHIYMYIYYNIYYTHTRINQRKTRRYEASVRGQLVWCRRTLGSRQWLPTRCWGVGVSTMKIDGKTSRWSGFRRTTCFGCGIELKKKCRARNTSTIWLGYFFRSLQDGI